MARNRRSRSVKNSGPSRAGDRYGRGKASTHGCRGTEGHSTGTKSKRRRETISESGGDKGTKSKRRRSVGTNSKMRSGRGTNSKVGAARGRAARGRAAKETLGVTRGV